MHSIKDFEVVSRFEIYFFVFFIHIYHVLSQSGLSAKLKSSRLFDFVVLFSDRETTNKYAL